MFPYYLLFLLVLLCTIVHQFFTKPIFLILYWIALFFGLLLQNRQKKSFWQKMTPFLPKNIIPKLLVFLFFGVVVVFQTTLKEYRFSQAQVVVGCPSWVISSIWDSFFSWSFLKTQNQHLQTSQLPNPIPPSATIQKCVTLVGEQGRPYSYDLYLFSKNIVAKTIDYKPILVQDLIWPIFPISTIWLLKTIPSSEKANRFFSSRYQGIPEWVLLGITDNISKETYQTILDSWLVYLVAASGWNIVFLTIFLGFLFAVFSNRKRAFLQSASVVWYGVFLRSNMALQRAVFSYLVSWLLTRKGRVVSSRNLLLIVVVFCSLFNPYLLVSSWGFVLSVAGVRGILQIPKTRNKHTILRTIAPAVRAFAALSGPLLLLTEKINLLTVVGSLPAWFLTMIISYLSLVVLIFGWLWGELLFFLIKWLLFLIKLVAEHGIYFELHNQLFSYGIRIVSWFFIWSLRRRVDRSVYK